MKHVGEGVIEEIIEERKLRGAFLHFHDFVSRLGGSVNKKAVEFLIKAGAFDFGQSSMRSTLQANMEQVINGVANAAKKQNRRAVVFFDQNVLPELNYTEMIKQEPWDEQETIAYEKEATGFISRHIRWKSTTRL